ncbi:MAG: hypothetical protein ACRDZY_22315 [Acidimicrobiales bacterium]
MELIARFSFGLMGALVVVAGPERGRQKRAPISGTRRGWRRRGDRVFPPWGGARLGRITDSGPAGAPRSPDRRDPAA